MPIRILLVDKRELFREGLAKMLNGQPGMEVLGACGSIVEAVEKAGEFKPDTSHASDGSNDLLYQWPN